MSPPCNHLRWVNNLSAALILAVAVPALSDERPYSNSGACTAAETWVLPSDFAEGFENEFHSSMSGRTPAIRGLGEAMALRAQAKRIGEKYFAEYWVALSLYQLKLDHLAFNGFSALAAKEGSAETGSIQAAALDCLAEIHAVLPTLLIPEGVATRLSQIPSSSGRDKVASLLIRQFLGAHEAPARAEVVATLIRPNTPDASLSKGLIRVAQHKPVQAAEHLKLFLENASIPRHLESYRDQARLLYARALYALGSFDEAESQYKTISKNSNDLAQALSELTWSYLRNEKYAEAIGTAINLSSGGLRKTFAPEAPMVMAMAFNELCHFPDAIRAIQSMRSQYTDSYDWLKANASRTNSVSSPYEMIIQFLKTNQTTVPRRIMTEWIRTPHFIGRQGEINNLSSRRKQIESAQKLGSEEQIRLARDLLAFMKDLRPRYEKARELAHHRGEGLPPDVESDLKTLRDKVAHYKRLKRSAEPFRRFAAFLDRKAPEIQARLVSEINSEMKIRTRHMLTLLEEVADNSHFIEVEIYQGASQDMIWQNAHPDYHELAKTLSDEANRGPASKAVWKWGKVEGGLSGTHEVWEDELGSFRADLFDNCSNKEKYLAIKRSETK